MFKVQYHAANALMIVHPPELSISPGDLFEDHVLFVWDQLMDPQVVHDLLGRYAPFVPAFATGLLRTVKRKDDGWDYDLIEEDNAVLQGSVLVGLSAEELTKLDDFEQVPIHRARHKVKVHLGDMERVVDIHLRAGSYLEE